MEVSHIIQQIDTEITKLQQARALLSGNTVVKVSKGPGRPKGSKNASSAGTSTATAAPAVKAKRKLSPEGRKRIAEAMKKRWAERRKQAPAK